MAAEILSLSCISVSVSVSIQICLVCLVAPGQTELRVLADPATPAGAMKWDKNREGGSQERDPLGEVED